jgi:hypothetical protein
MQQCTWIELNVLFPLAGYDPIGGYTLFFKFFEGKMSQ